MIGSLKNGLISERKPYVSSKPISNVKKFMDNPTEIAKYAKWATRGDGPALWRVPSVENLSPHDNNYIVRRYLLCFYFYDN
jgi:hypothetical protein